MKIGSLNIYGVIYKITNNINGKVYIGQTIDGFKIRYNGGKWWQQTHNIHLKSSVKKYGYENFIVNEVFDIAFSKVELDIKETLYINYYHSNNRLYGYNKRDGGSHGKHSEESLQRMSRAHTGVKLSKETRKRMSMARIGKRLGKDNPMYGISPKDRMSEEAYKNWIEKKRKSMIGENNPMYGRAGELNSFYGRQHTEESKRKISEANKRNNLRGESYNSKNVEVYNEKGNLIKIFDSVIGCAEWMVEINKCNNIGTARDRIRKNANTGKIYKELTFKTYRKNKQ